jgi:hypothetical protein
LKNIMQSVVTCGALAAAVLGVTSEAEAQELILNEYNAVGPTKNLEGGESDTFFGRITGNGGDWFELVVTEDGTDIRGYKLLWANDDGTPKSGTITFTNASIWSNLEAGTIITVRAGDTSDTSFTGCSVTPDWWIRIGASDTTYVTQSGSTFQTDNDGWRMKITTGANVTVQNWVGETSPNQSTTWAGSGVNSEEVGKLESDPSASSNTNYQDGNCSSFGSENCWDDGASTQDFSALRACP